MSSSAGGRRGTAATYDGLMARWLAPKSGVAKLVAQVVLLAVATGLVYLLVMWLGSDLSESNPL